MASFHGRLRSWLLDAFGPRPANHRPRVRPTVESLEDRWLLAIRFGVIGDYGWDGPNEAAVASLVKNWIPDFVITTGDNNYDVGSAATIDQNIGKHYQEFIGTYQGAYGPGSPTNRFWPSLGNHDWETTDAQPYLNYFTLPGNERYYEFIQGNVHFFVVDSDTREPDGRTSNSTQGQWLQQRLAASTSEFQVVYFHHSPYSSSSTHGSDPQMQWPFKQWGADVVLTGHDHTYERLVIDGLPYFVDGLGGRSIYGFGSPIPGSQFRYNANYGAMRITADTGSMLFEFFSITGGGTLIDSYTLTSAPLPTLSIDDVTVVEGDSGTTTAATFTVSLSEASSQVVTVNYSTANGTARAGRDFTGVNNAVLSFQPGETSRPITISVKGDKSVEADETFFVNLASPAGATLADSQGLGTILNDDAGRGGTAASESPVGAADSVIAAIAEGRATVPDATPRLRAVRAAAAVDALFARIETASPTSPLSGSRVGRAVRAAIASSRRVRPAYGTQNLPLVDLFLSDARELDAPTGEFSGQ